MENSYLRRPIPLAVSVLLALVIYSPLLMMQLPLTSSYDANFHVFFASHYAQHWFNPWNEKWYAGFSQTTYPPLGHQWIALLSYVVGLRYGLMLVQLCAVLLVPVGVYRFARIWVSERAASYAAFLSVFVGAMAFLVFAAGQLSTTLSAPIYLLAMPYFYYWSRSADWKALLKGVVLIMAAASVHHVTLIFGSLLLALPVLWLACIDRERSSIAAVFSRSVVFGALTGIGVATVLLPYWLSILKHPIEQIPIPHGSRTNLLLNPAFLMNYFLVPYGAILLALPFVLWVGSRHRRLRPLLLGFWAAFILGLGGTTPLPKLILRRAFEVLTFERFTLLAAFLVLPLIGLVAERAVERLRWKAVGVFAVCAVATITLPFIWMVYSPFHATGALNVEPVLNFLNHDGHDRYRYITLGFGNSVPKISTYTDATSVDGEYNSARLLPELTHYGSAQLSNSKFFGTAGMESLRAMLMHANHYGLKFIFVHDPYYEPLLAFAGWRKIETYDSGSIGVWSKDDVPPARPIVSDAIPPHWQGLMWGTLPMASSFLAILLLVFLRDHHESSSPLVEVHEPAEEPEYAPEVRL
ncbi:MAG: hypothetical protein H0X25_14360 [Acidobacteriales bacterium]|nr:hypothetical protein [Terriglobales bacterium]